MQVIRDPQYRILGYIETRADRTQVGKDAQYRIVGYYDPRTDQTKDAQYRIVAQGNILAALVTSAC